jgi:hypothetical protein
LIQTVVVEKEEQYWPRGLIQTAVELAGFFASADAGLGTTLALPDGFGEVYATIVNGSNYTSRELDRFKDFAARLTVAPFARSGGYVRTLQISPWYSDGTRGSDFAVRRGTVAPVSAGRRRDRYGVLITARDPRLSLGAHFARKTDVIESADTTLDLAPLAITRTGSVVSFHTIVRPFAYASASGSSPFWLVLRADHVKPDVDARGYQRFFVAGASWDLTPRISATLDVQAGYPKAGLVAPDTRTVLLQLIANF